MSPLEKLLGKVNPITYAAIKYKSSVECRIHAHKGGRRLKSRAPQHVWLTRFSKQPDPACGTCNDSGIVGMPPDDYSSCPDCSATSGESEKCQT